MRKGVLTSILFAIFVVSSYTNAESLEERVKNLEEKVKQLEAELRQLKSGSINSKGNVQSVENKPSKEVVKSNQDSKAVNPPNPVEFKVVEKRFVPAEFRSSIWRREDKIVFKVDFKYKLKKNADVIIGDFIIKDKNGNVLYKKQVKINKALNIFKGTEIKPNEVVRMEISIPYKASDEKLRKIDETPKDELRYEFKPTQVVFSDDSTIYYKKAW